MAEILLPGQEIKMKMSLPALVKICDYILDHHWQMKPGETFTITGTDGRKLTMLFTK